jgi:hypothetical protein
MEELRTKGQLRHYTQNCEEENKQQLTVVSPTTCTILLPDIFYFNITLNTATCFDGNV